MSVKQAAIVVCFSPPAVDRVRSARQNIVWAFPSSTFPSPHGKTNDSDHFCSSPVVLLQPGRLNVSCLEHPVTNGHRSCEEEVSVTGRVSSGDLFLFVYTVIFAWMFKLQLITDLSEDHAIPRRLL